MDATALRETVLATARAMNASGINRGTAGNVSARLGDGFLITPSGVPYDDCTLERLVEVGLDGVVRGAGKPSSEWRFHRDIYAARSEVDAIVHTHSPSATSLACLGRPIPAFHYMVAAAGGHDIRVADYATFGGQQLSDNALVALEGRRACLLDRHGVIATGNDCRRALALAVEVENLAEMYCRVLALGEPRVLDGEEMDRVLERFRGYGPAAGADDGAS
jgi:L-fuculose-phosphate aldolase